MLNQIGSTCCHDGMMHYQRIPITGSRDRILEIVLILWNVTYSRSSDHYALIKEVEIVESIHELVRSRSITSPSYFPNFFMFDTMITSVLKILFNSKSNHRKETVSKSNEPKIPTDSCEEDKLLT